MSCPPSSSAVLAAGSGGKIVEVACWAHARRKFYDAQNTAGRVAHEALARIGQLYAIERELADARAGSSSELARDEWHAQVAAVRQERARPLLDSLGQWLETEQRRALPKSPLGQAVAYALSNWAALSRYPEQGYLAIDNNLSERTLRPAAVGRKNWLFVGNDQAGQTAAVLFTMIATAKANGVDPFAYLRDVLSRMPLLLASTARTPAEADLAPFLPDRWLAANPTARFTPNRSAR